MKIARLSFPATTQGQMVNVEDVDLTVDELKTLAELVNNMMRPTPTPTIAAAPLYRAINCEYRDKCIDKYEQCQTCANNKAQSYYEERKLE